MKVLVLTEDYPNNKGGVSLMYVHTRNIYYREKGVEVVNLNFSATGEYVIDGIRVINLDIYDRENDCYDLLLLHAANLRHHYRFLRKYGERFQKFMFFYHGHEVLKIHSVYSKPYPYQKENIVKVLFQNLYDDFKLHVWRRYIPQVVSKSWFVFVSEWMLSEFEKWTGISRQGLKGRYSITYNCVGNEFERERFDSESVKSYDFITIRGNIDGSKYSIDLVNEMAKKTPRGRFLLIGKGKFFDYNEKAGNLMWWDKTLSHSEILDVLNKSRFALMPTKTDAQGLMMCEMAAFGIPVITSDIPVCHEVFNGFNNVYYISNDNLQSLDGFLDMKEKCIKDERYYRDTTVEKEYRTICQLLQS